MNTYNIYARIDEFVLKCLKFAAKLPSQTEYQVMGKQLMRSCTSIGANAQEADGSQSKADFIHCLTIAKKEAKETQYWITLLTRYNTNLDTATAPLVQECKEIVAIMSQIIINTKQKIGK